MSDYEYQDDYQYEQQPEEEEQNVETKVELQYLEIEDLIRRNQWQQSIQWLETLFVTCEENKLKNYKVKILNQLLQIYCKNLDIDHICVTLRRISQLNKQEKYSESSIKFIINLLRSSEYRKIHKEVFKFIDDLEFGLKLKSYMLLLDKAIDQKDSKQAGYLFDFVAQQLSQSENPSASLLVEFYSLQIKYSKFTGVDINDRIHEMELKIPALENEAYMSEGHISVLKLAIAEIMYEYGNFQNSTLYLADVFLQKAKYGNSSQLKQYLKTNVLLSLLIQNMQLRKDQKYNALFNEISIPFKNEKDVQALVSLVDSYEKHDLEMFKQNYTSINFKPESEKYLGIYEKLLFNLKKEKLIGILKSYKTIKFDYIARRLDLSEQFVEKMVFELIVDEKIRGRIFDADQKNRYLQVLPAKNEFLIIQAENLRELSKRYLSV